jgi:cupin fold WbuC family metalloprotein
MYILDDKMIDGLCHQADFSSRRRQHFNIHSSYQESCQRLLNAIQPNSYIPPHRHSVADKQELLVAIRGVFSLITFDDDGGLVQSVCFGTEKYSEYLCTNVGVEIPSGTWHTVSAMQANSVLLEIKEGPFVANVSKEFALWAPQVGSSRVDSFMAKCYKFAEVN